MGDAKWKLFSLKTIKTHYSLLPIVGLVAIAIPSDIAAVIYLLCTRDVAYITGAKSINEKMDLLNPYSLKLYTVSELPKLPHLHEAYKEMAKMEKEEARLLGGSNRKK
ncbi:uncharacterized protein LOC106670425 [Cimex lectularius]|uniref:Uncharacterized protein n=1 Tax=Cimex lectularius TaxID=79782 RepID=A0A8I6S5N6_CIMLE|nr:uncharacterized protein LOC106670425 [Cimex lectularius]